MKEVRRKTPRDQELHIILDNLSAHKTPEVQKWRETNLYVHFHFTPTSSSWLNAVEGWFAQLERRSFEFRTSDEAIFRDIEAAAESIVRQTLADIGYRDGAHGIDPRRCRVQVAFKLQAREIGQGVDRTDGELGAGDQGLMFGYAYDETPDLMPLPIRIAHALMPRQAELRRSGEFPWLRPDAKSQVTVRYVDRVPVGVEKVVLSTQHGEDIDTPSLRAEVRRHIVEQVISEHLRDGPFEVLINPTGRFTVGGPKTHTGLTGRKIIVDTYGGACPHGGGAFSGKEPSKVDRSAAYMARYIAKNLVAARCAQLCPVQIAYAIGTVEPVSFLIDTQGIGSAPEELEALAGGLLNLTPQETPTGYGLGPRIWYNTMVAQETWSSETTGRTLTPRSDRSKAFRDRPLLRPWTRQPGRRSLKGHYYRRCERPEERHTGNVRRTRRNEGELAPECF